MASVDPIQGTSLAPSAPAPAPAPPASSSGFSFHDLLDIVNPLEHIPVVSTIYRALTGEQIKPFTKIAGDLLYGGPVGFLSSVADTVFQSITGKDFGDTVLSFFTGNHDGNAVASSSAAAPASVQAQANIASPDMSALMTSMSRNGIDPSLARRAASAYRRAIDLTPQPSSPASSAQPVS